MKRKMVACLLAVSLVAGLNTGCGKMDSSTNREAATGDTTYTESCADVAEYPEISSNSTEEDCVDEVWTDEAPISEGEYYAEVEAVKNASYEDIQFSYKESDFENEKYTSVEENGWNYALSNPLSTFAADVDTGSYSNFRRMINSGYGLNSIPSDAIRTEEMVNYFTYNYEEPKKGEVFGVDSQISTCPWNKKNLLLSVGINTKSIDSKDIPDCNIVFLIDVSGSMKTENKLPLIQKSMAMLVDSFDKKDRISIVTYASGVNTVLDGCKGDADRKIIRAFENLSAGGSTNGGDGIQRAYEIAEKNYIKNGVNRVIICSDGDFNVGLTSQSELENLISREKESGIFLSTLGFGMGNYSDTTMETLADKGNGNYAYIDDLTEAKKVLIDEMTKTFVTVAKDVKLQVEFNPEVVSRYRLIGYENRSLSAMDFRDDTKDGGELGAGHQVTVLYEIVTSEAEDEITLKYQDDKKITKASKYDEYATLSIAYKDIDANKSKYIEYPINLDNYTKNPSYDYRLAASVAQASLALKNSEYLVDYNNEEAIEESVRIIKSLKNKYDDEYVKEFAKLLEQSVNNDDYYYGWYE